MNNILSIVVVLGIFLSALVGHELGKRAKRNIKKEVIDKELKRNKYKNNLHTAEVFMTGAYYESFEK